MKLNKNKFAFSLIELSITILIIGLLVAGIIKGTSLYQKIQLTSAQNITSNSPVNRTKDLKMWLETSLKSSFVAGIKDGNQVSTWLDQKLDVQNKINPTQNTTGNRPIYQENYYNGIPSVKFDGANDFLPYNANFLVGSDYTIFVVDIRNSNKNGNYFLGGTSSSGPNQNLVLGYRFSNTLTQAHYTNDMNLTPSPTISINKPYIHVISFSKTSGKLYRFYQNGYSSTGSAPAQTAALTSYTNASIGRYKDISDFYSGHILELIMFSRTLKNSERVAIEDYLGQKYSIKINR